MPVLDLLRLDRRVAPPTGARRRLARAMVTDAVVLVDGVAAA